MQGISTYSMAREKSQVIFSHLSKNYQVFTQTRRICADTFEGMLEMRLPG
jgi:hypothetical protein